MASGTARLEVSFVRQLCCLGTTASSVHTSMRTGPSGSVLFGLSSTCSGTNGSSLCNWRTWMDEHSQAAGGRSPLLGVSPGRGGSRTGRDQFRKGGLKH